MECDGYVYVTIIVFHNEMNTAFIVNLLFLCMWVSEWVNGVYNHTACDVLIGLEADAFNSV